MAAQAGSLTPLRLLGLGGSLAPWLLGSLTPLRLLGLCRCLTPCGCSGCPGA